MPPREPTPFDEALKGLSAEELRDVAENLMRLGRQELEPKGSTRRRKPAKQPFTLTLRVELVGAKPPIWRQVEVPSTLRLDQVHDLAQALFGWTKSHLHRFAMGDSVWDHGEELFLCPFDVEEGENEGVAASLVRLDEVLRDVGDRLLYVYDYGDEWTLTFQVEATSAGQLVAPRVLGGRGQAPPDDSGGIHVWNEAGGDAPVDLDAVRYAVDEAAAEWLLPAPLVELQRRLLGHPSYQLVVDLIAASGLREPEVSTSDDVADAVRPWAWLLDRVGDGLSLTQAGHLPPKDVLAAMTELGMAEEWFGKGNREVHARPVADIRRSAQRFGLLRVSKGRLLPTKAGTAARGDVALLAETVAEKAGGLQRSAFARELSTLLLLVVAAGRTLDDANKHDVVRVLGDLGWSKSGEPLDVWDLRWADEDTRMLLDVTGADRGLFRPEPPPPAAQVMARLTLRVLS